MWHSYLPENVWCTVMYPLTGKDLSTLVDRYNANSPPAKTAHWELTDSFPANPNVLAIDYAEVLRVLKAKKEE